MADAPTVPAHFFINLLLRASLAHFPYLYLFWALLANILIVPTHLIISFLRLPWPIYFSYTSFTLMGFFVRSSGLSRPNYHILTSYYFLGLLSFKLNPISLLIYILDILGPFTSFLPLIMSRTSFDYIWKPSLDLSKKEKSTLEYSISVYFTAFPLPEDPLFLLLSFWH